MLGSRPIQTLRAGIAGSWKRPEHPRDIMDWCAYAHTTDHGNRDQQGPKTRKPSLTQDSGTINPGEKLPCNMKYEDMDTPAAREALPTGQ